MEFTWVTDPPIYEKTREEFGVLLERFEELLEGWNVPEDGSKEAKRWNKRLGDTREVMSMASWGGDACYAYMLCGEPAGLMVVEDDTDDLRIEELFTHPGSESVGGMLVEHAATLSEKAGHNGRLSLISLNKRSTKAYRAWDCVSNGFVDSDGGGGMNLDPSKSAKWQRENGKWRLRKYAHLKAMAGVA